MRSTRRVLRRMYECESGKACPLMCSYSLILVLSMVYAACSSRKPACCATRVRTYELSILYLYQHRKFQLYQTGNKPGR